jgi:hypothetical protein
VEGAVALSDSCWDFLDAVSIAARMLADDAGRYSSPDSAIQYESGEAKVLCRASRRAEDLRDPEDVARLIRLAKVVMNFHDTVPRSPDLPERRREMEAAIRLAGLELGPEDDA